MRLKYNLKIGCKTSSSLLLMLGLGLPRVGVVGSWRWGTLEVWTGAGSDIGLDLDIGLVVAVLGWGWPAAAKRTLLDHVVGQDDEQRFDSAVPLGLDLLKDCLQLLGGEGRREETNSLDVVHRSGSGVA